MKTRTANTSAPPLAWRRLTQQFEPRLAWVAQAHGRGADDVRPEGGERSQPHASDLSWPLSEAGDDQPAPCVHGGLRPGPWGGSLFNLDRPAPGFRDSVLGGETERLASWPVADWSAAAAMANGAPLRGALRMTSACVSCPDPTAKTTWGVDSRFGPVRIHRGRTGDPFVPAAVAPGAARSPGTHQACRPGWERPPSPRAWWGRGAKCACTRWAPPSRGSLPFQ